MSIVLLLCGTIFSGCQKEDEDEYFVKYIVQTSNANTEGYATVVFYNEYSKEYDVKISQNQSWQIVIGPVHKGYQARVRVINTTGTSGLHVYSEIDVSKNASPFAFKTSDGPQAENVWVNTSDLKHTINY